MKVDLEYRQVSTLKPQSTKLVMSHLHESKLEKSKMNTLKKNGLSAFARDN